MTAQPADPVPGPDTPRVHTPNIGRGASRRDDRGAIAGGRRQVTPAPGPNAAATGP